MDAGQVVGPPLPAGPGAVGHTVKSHTRSTSKSAVFRRFVAATETVLASLLAADLSGLDLVAFMVHGVHFAGHCCIVALGIGLDGIKVPLGLADGSTENGTVVTDLIVDLPRAGHGRDPAHLGGHRRIRGVAPGHCRPVRPH